MHYARTGLKLLVFLTIVTAGGTAAAIPITYHTDLEAIVNLPEFGGDTLVGTIALELDFDTDDLASAWGNSPEFAQFVASATRIEAISYDSGWPLSGNYSGLGGYAEIDYMDIGLPGAPPLPFLHLYSGNIPFGSGNEFVLSIDMDMIMIPVVPGDQIELPIYAWSDVGSANASLAFMTGPSMSLNTVNSYTILRDPIVPEPGSFMLLAIAIGGVAVRQRLRPE